MINYEPYIVKDNGRFYFDLEEYNQSSDIQIEDGDTIKFTYEKERYTGKVISIGSKKNQYYLLEVSKKV